MDTPLDQLLRRAVDTNASDIHLKVGSPPVVRIDGELRRMQDIDRLKPADTEGYAREIFTKKAAQQFNATNEADFAYGRQDLGRFRVSAYRQRGSVSLILRRVVPGVPSLDRIGLPPIARRLAAEHSGLIVVSGPSGSGRTTTLAAMVEHINQTRPVSIVTVEDPIEVLFPDKMGIVAQREVGVDTDSFASGLDRATRQDADVIMVSQITDAATAAAALAAAETGHLVLGAMHTADPADTVNRLFGFFPADRQPSLRPQLANLLRAVISQRLIDTADGTGRVLASEIMTGNTKIAEVIAGGGSKEHLDQIIGDAEFFGMQTFDKSLLDLVKQRTITVASALPHVRNSHDFRAKAIEAGIEV